MNKLKLLIIDVDGTMTDGGIYYDENGNELKKFCTKDAAGFFAAHAVGIKTMVLTGRECNATAKRVAELKVDYLFQNVKNKVEFLTDFIKKNGIRKAEVGYIGDDLNDYSSMKLAGFVACPYDACPEVKAIANYISPVSGGYGAVRNIIEFMLRKNGKWETAVKDAYGIGT